MKTQYDPELVQGPQDLELDRAWLISSHADGKCQGKHLISLKTQTSILKAFQGVRYKKHGCEGTEPGGREGPAQRDVVGGPAPAPLLSSLENCFHRWKMTAFQSGSNPSSPGSLHKRPRGAELVWLTAHPIADFCRSLDI